MEKSGKIKYSGENLTGIIIIANDEDSKSIKVTISEDIMCKIYSGSSIDSIDTSKVLLETNIAGTYTLNVPDNIRTYYYVTTPKGNAIMAEKHLPMVGGYNFRDIGGYRTIDGRYVKWGTFFRSDDMNLLTESDLYFLSNLHLKTIIDFRSEEETLSKPDRLPASVINRYVYTIEPGNIVNLLKTTMQPGKQDFHNAMIEINRELVTNEHIIEQYCKFFSQLQKEENIPLLFHCSAGKDRTGLAAALVLSALDVDEQTIMQDYLLSNIYLRDKYDSFITRPEMEPLIKVNTDYLNSALTAIKEKHGSMENYLSKELNVDIEAFQNKYLY